MVVDVKKYKYDGTKVVENATNLIIQVTKSKEDAKKLAASLNGGCGFGGETPRFFVYAKDQNGSTSN
jgi:hypothetical protein